MAGVIATIDVPKQHQGLDGGDLQVTSSWRRILRWIVDVVLLPCKRRLFLLLPLVGRGPYVVSGTLLWRPDDANKKLTLCLHEPVSAQPLLFVDLPLDRFELVDARRVALECDRRWPGTGASRPLLDEPKWAVHCNGRKAGFAGRRAPTEGEAAVLQALSMVSAGIGRLTTAAAGGGVGESLAYMRVAFERVVGSADSESFHLAGGRTSLGLDLSIFFFRVR